MIEPIFRQFSIVILQREKKLFSLSRILTRKGFSVFVLHYNKNWKTRKRNIQISKAQEESETVVF